MKSLLTTNSHGSTRIAFTPIITYPATEFDTIYTVMINYRDVLLQKQLPYGPLWSDEGVYRVAKELQLHHPEKFCNIFLGVGGFHLDKVIIACCGSYLEEYGGIDSVLVESEIFGVSVMKPVMNGSSCVRGKRGICLIAEALEHLQLSIFWQQCDPSILQHVSENAFELQSLMNSYTSQDQNSMLEAWNRCSGEILKFQGKFNEFRKHGCEKSETFLYWDKFINKLAPALRDLTSSFREGTGTFIYHLFIEKYLFALYVISDGYHFIMRNA